MIIDTLFMSLKNLSRKKSRSILTITGIAIGVASVVLISSIGDIGKRAVNDELSALAVGGVMVSGNQKIAGAQLTELHLDAIRSSGAVDSAIPIIVDYTKSYMRELMLDVVVWGIDYGANQVISLDAMYGRLITKNDVRGAKNVCVVDQNIANAYYRRDNIVGKTLTLQFAGGYEDFEVVGIVSSGGSLMQGLMGDIIPSFAYIPYTTMQRLSKKATFDQIAVKTKQGIDADVAAAQLVTSVNSASGITSGFKAENMQTQKAKLNGVLDTVTLVLSAIAAVSLVVSGLSIMTLMLASVKERTREIGIKKSIGASKRNILSEFLIEALTISLLGGIIGVLAGVSLVAMGCVAFKLPIQLNAGLILSGMLFSVISGVVFGVHPAILAASLKPVDALRCE